MAAASAGRVGLQQRVLPTYRAAFFEMLGNACPGGLSVFAGQPRPSEAIETTETLPGVDLVRAGNLHLLRGAAYLCLQRGLLAWLDRRSPQVLIMEANPRYLSSPAAVRWMHARGRPVIGWGLGAPPAGGLTGGLRIMFRRRFVAQFDAMITYSEQGAEEYIGLGSPPGRTFIAANAVAARPGPQLERASPTGRPGRILFVGRLQARKRVDLLLEAAAKLEPRPELMIVGDGPERQRLQALAANVFPPAQFAGAQFGEALQSHFAWADLFVLPGTGGLAVQQAMASGLPVVVARGDGTQRDLVSGDNGWLITPDDLRALTASLREAFSDPERLVAMGRRSHQLAAERFNIESMTAVFLRAIESVAGG